MTPNKGHFYEYKSIKGKQNVILGNGYACKAIGIGSVKIKTKCKGVAKTYRMNNVLHVPGLVNNIFSVNAATRKGH